MGEENNNNFSLNNEKGEFIINKETNKEKPEITEKQGEFAVNKEENLEENTNKENINGNENLLNNDATNLKHSEKEQGEFNIKRDNIVEDKTYDNKTEKNIDEIKPIYNDFSNQYVFKSAKEMEKIKKENKKNLKILLIAFVCFVAVIGISIALFFSSYEKGYKSYIDNGISSDEYFEITPASFIDLQNYYLENIFNEYITEDGTELLKDFSFNESKGCYEAVLNEECDFIFQIYPTANDKEIKKIVVSFNWGYDYLNNDMDKVDKATIDLLNYISIIYNSICGYDNYDYNKELAMLDKLTTGEFISEDSTSSEYKDNKAIYTMTNNTDAIMAITITPIK